MKPLNKRERAFIAHRVNFWRLSKGDPSPYKAAYVSDYMNQLRHLIFRIVMTVSDNETTD